MLKLSYPQLHSIAKSDKVSLKSILELNNIHSHFNLPLSEEAYEQFCELEIFLFSMQANGQDDV
jgi:hypothetical protein